MAVQFYLSPRPDKFGDCPIRVSISIGGNRLISTVGYSIHPDKWDAKNLHRVKKGCSNGRRIPYNIINVRLDEIQSFFDKYEIFHATATMEELAAELAKIKGVTSKLSSVDVKQKRTLISYFDEFVKEEGRASQWTTGTHECWTAFRGHLANQGAIDFDFFDESGMKKFVEYLRKENKRLKKRAMEEKTVQKHFSNLKWFLNWCIRKGYCTEAQVSKYRPKFKVIEKPVIFLTRDELMKLYHYKVPNNGDVITLHDRFGDEYTKVVSDASALEKTRDLFCFCAFTSLRYSDMAKLKKTDIVGGKINATTKKTNDKLEIELNDYAKAILDKYKDVEFPHDLALPVISNQRMNDYIKHLGELCEFNEPITRICYKAGQRVELTQSKWEMLGTHAGRRTFICTALSFGIAPQVVMKWTGHSDYKAMRPYIEIAESVKAEAMSMFNKMEG